MDEDQFHEFSDEAYENLDTFTEELVEMINDIVDNYADLSKKDKKELVIKCVTPDEHCYDVNDVAFHDSIINYNYKNMKLKRKSKDSFILYSIEFIL